MKLLTFALLFSVSVFLNAQELVDIDGVIPNELDDEFMANVTKTSIKRGRIQYGLRAYEGQFPFTAWLNMLLGDGWMILCGGTLISPNFVVSAAHCIDNTLQGLNVHLGSVDNNNFPTRISANAYTKHPQYKAPGTRNLEHDISLIRLSSNAQYQPAYLPARWMTSTSFAGQSMTVAGWGRTELGTGSRYLLYTTENGVECEDCFICGKAYGGGTGSGDSGGPLVQGYTLIGVVSFSVGDRDGFVRVDRYLDWISSVTGIRT